MTDENGRRDLLHSVFGLSEQIGKVEFPLLIKESTGYDVFPVDLSKSTDKNPIDLLKSILGGFLKTSTSTRSRYQGSRVNEVGRRIEESIVNEMNKLPLLKRLGKTGYPDIEISYKDSITYLEMKTSSVKLNSGFRYFYYTKGDKIKSDARHLLLDVAVTEESPRYWKVDSWYLSDLSKLRVRLKNEFNASKGDLINLDSRLTESV